MALALALAKAANALWIVAFFASGAAGFGDGSAGCDDKAGSDGVASPATGSCGTGAGSLSPTTTTGIGDCGGSAGPVAHGGGLGGCTADDVVADTAGLSGTLVSCSSSSPSVAESKAAGKLGWKMSLHHCDGTTRLREAMYSPLLPEKTSQSSAPSLWLRCNHRLFFVMEFTM